MVERHSYKYIAWVSFTLYKKSPRCYQHQSDLLNNLQYKENCYNHSIARLL
nr:MAG TPA: hypothetical protein [Caudoviricetes sp.]